MKAEIYAILFDGIIYKVGNTNESLAFAYSIKPFSPKVEKIEQINDTSVKVFLSNKAFALVPVNNSIIFYYSNMEEVK